MAPIPTRIFWSVEQLAAAGADRLLEIGCGPGVAAGLVAAKLTAGRLTAIDRSAKAIAAARLRNQAHEASGKVAFVECALADFAGEPAAFDKLFAINVNLFWIDPRRELPVVARVLAPGGRLFLFYDPPSAAQRRKAAEQCVSNLEAHGFLIDRLIEVDRHSSGLLAIVARPAA